MCNCNVCICADITDICSDGENIPVKSHTFDFFGTNCISLFVFFSFNRKFAERKASGEAMEDWLVQRVSRSSGLKMTESGHGQHKFLLSFLKAESP